MHSVTLSAQPDLLSAFARTLGGLPVHGTVVGSMADVLGLQRGDIVLRVNGVNARELHRIRFSQSGSQGVEFQVLRQGSLVELSLPEGTDPVEALLELSDYLVGRACA